MHGYDKAGEGGVGGGGGSYRCLEVGGWGGGPIGASRSGSLMVGRNISLLLLLRHFSVVSMCLFAW